MALMVLQITIDLSVRIAWREVSLIFDQILSCRNIIAFQISLHQEWLQRKKFKSYWRHLYKYTWHCYLLFFFLNNCALFILNNLLLSSSLCFSFPPQYDFHLQITVPLSTQNLLWTENIMHSVLFLLWWTSWVTSLSYPIEVFFTGWNNFYFSFLYFHKIFPNTDIMIWWWAHMPYCFSVFFPKIWAGPINKNASLATNLSHILRSL